MPTASASAIKEKAKRLTFGAVAGALLSSGVLAVVMGAGAYVQKVDRCMVSLDAVETLAARHEVSITALETRSADIVTRLDRIEGKLDVLFFGSPAHAVTSGTNATNAAAATP